MITMLALTLTALILALPGMSQTDGPTLRIGLIPEQNIFQQAARYEPLGTWIESRSGIRLRFVTLVDYADALEQLRDGQLDGAFLGSWTAAAGIAELDLEPIARPVHPDGTSTYRGYLLVRKGSGIETVAEMKGKVMVFVSRATTAGFAFPIAYLRERGVKRIEDHFREHYFAGSHDAAIRAVLDGKADVGCAKNTIFEQSARTEPRLREELVILAESAPVPSNGLVIRGDLAPAFKDRLRETLVRMHQEPEGRSVLTEFGAQRFIATEREDYAPVHDLAQKVGIPLAVGPEGEK